MKKSIDNFLNNKYTEGFLISLILFNVFIFIFETDKNFYSTFDFNIQCFEWFSVIIFSIEYILRVISLEKFKDILKPLMIIDLISIVPFYLSLSKINTIVFRVLRLFRLLRIAKLTRYTNAFTNIKRIFILKKHELLVTFGIFLAGLTLSSILIYYAECQVNSAAFKSIPSSFWWSIITFTSIGYGDVYPITTEGKIIASMSAIIGICLNGLFIGIISSAFMEAIEHKKHIKEKFRENHNINIHQS